VASTPAASVGAEHGQRGALASELPASGPALPFVPTSVYGTTVNARERLIASAQELLWQRGYSGTSPRMIQDHAAAGQGSMYHHFAGKADLAAAALSRTADVERGRADALLSEPGTALERVVGYLTREREVLRGCPIGRHAHDSEVVADPILRAPIEETFTWLRDRIRQVLEQGQSDEQVRADLDVEGVAAAVVAIIQGGYVLARASASSDPFDQAVEGAVQLVSAIGV